MQDLFIHNTNYYFVIVSKIYNSIPLVILLEA